MGIHLAERHRRSTKSYPLTLALAKFTRPTSMPRTRAVGSLTCDGRIATLRSNSTTFHRSLGLTAGGPPNARRSCHEQIPLDDSGDLLVAFPYCRLRGLISGCCGISQRAKSMHNERR